jgi:alkanesulfonate monooxygenase SsuD/methylene tetrahydromethanopterin reductase-like flavin-dependent oxidoreductase (luciferase family)
MEVGLYFDVRSRPDLGQHPARTYGFVLEACEEADRAGIHSAWFTEHHSFADGYLPQPLTFAAAVAARTQKLRVGASVLLAPLRQPIQIAEEAAVVDLVSEGRLELGLSGGYMKQEYELFGVPERYVKRTSTYVRWAEEILELWASGKATPPPLQDPFPIWLGVNGPRGARAAGRLGLGILRVLPQLLDVYREGLVEGGHDPDSARFFGPVQAFLTDDPERDRQLILEHIAYQWQTYRDARELTRGNPSAARVRPEEIRTDGPLPGGPEIGFVFGTPEQVAQEIVRATTGTPTVGIHFWASVGGMPEEMVMRNIQLAATRLVPLLRDA